MSDLFSHALQLLTNLCDAHIYLQECLCSRIGGAFLSGILTSRVVVVALGTVLVKYSLITKDSNTSRTELKLPTVPMASSRIEGSQPHRPYIKKLMPGLKLAAH